MTAQLRAEGKSDREVSAALDERDPTLATRGQIQPAQYSIHDSPLIRLPYRWAAGHPDPLVSIVGRLQEGSFSVAGPEGERHQVVAPANISWRSLDPLVVYFLGLLVRCETAWATFWSRTPKVRAELGLWGFYAGTALRRTARLERESDPAQVAEMREVIRPRIDWIMAQDEEPERLPWEEEAAA